MEQTSGIFRISTEQLNVEIGKLKVAKAAEYDSIVLDMIGQL